MTKIHNGSIINAALAEKVTYDAILLYQFWPERASIHLCYIVMYFVFKRVINWLIINFVLSSLVRAEVFLLPPKDVVILVPWGFSCVRQEFSVSAKGRRYERRSREKKLFSRVALWMKTWQKSETVQEKSLSNRESFWFQWNSGPVLSIIFFSFGFHFEWIFVVDICPCLIFFLFLPPLPAPFTFPIVRPLSNRGK